MRPAIAALLLLSAIPCLAQEETKPTNVSSKETWNLDTCGAFLKLAPAASNDTVVLTTEARRMETCGDVFFIANDYEHAAVAYGVASIMRNEIIANLAAVFNGNGKYMTEAYAQLADKYNALVDQYNGLLNAAKEATSTATPRTAKMQKFGLFLSSFAQNYAAYQAAHPEINCHSVSVNMGGGMASTNTECH